MAYTPVRSGFTGPSAKIGGSSDYHIDLKLLESLPVAERVKAIDSLARQYQSIGREIEFSNDAVSGKRWDLNKDMSDKVDLLQRAAAAHSHSKNTGFQSLDFYVPFKGKSRFTKGTVEDASIFLPGVAGGKIKRGSGGGYGYYSESLDPSGKVLFRVGHGNVDRPEAKGEFTVGAASSTLPIGGATTSNVDSELLAQAYVKSQLENQAQQGQLINALTTVLREKEKPKTLMEQMKEGLVGGMIKQALTPTNFLSQYMGDEPYIQGQRLGTNQFLTGNL